MGFSTKIGYVLAGSVHEPLKAIRVEEKEIGYLFKYSFSRKEGKLTSGYLRKLFFFPFLLVNNT